MNTTWSRPTKYIVGVGLVLLGIFILNLSRPVIPLLVVAALIAVIVRPVILWLQSRVHLPRGLAVGLVYLGLAILVPLVILLTSRRSLTRWSMSETWIIKASSRAAQNGCAQRSQRSRPPSSQLPDLTLTSTEL